MRPFGKRAVLRWSSERKRRIMEALEGQGARLFSRPRTWRTPYARATRASLARIVLLSPACTSWDMYPNYETGDHFKAIVQGMKG